VPESERDFERSYHMAISSIYEKNEIKK